MKKRGISSELVILLLGIAVIAIMLGGVIKGTIEYYKRGPFKPPKAFKETEFVPFYPDYSEEELKVLYSMQALRCSLNSVALGRLEFTNASVCPQEPVNWTKLENNVLHYGQANVQCQGREPDQIMLTREGLVTDNDKRWYASSQLSAAILDCWQRYQQQKPSEDTRCAYANATDMTVAVSEDDIKNYWKWFRQQPEGRSWAATIDQIIAWYVDRASSNVARAAVNGLALVGNQVVKGLTLVGNLFYWVIDHVITGGDAKPSYQWQRPVDVFGYQEYIGLDLLEFKPHSDVEGSIGSGTWCVDYVSARPHWKIVINNCENDAADQFKCHVEGFELPQKDVSDWIPAFGDPKWLVYYESFPAEAVRFWQKEWTDLFNIWTIGLVTASGVLNIGFGGGRAAKAVERAAARQLDEIAKKGARQLLEEGITEATKRIIQRFATKGYYNTMRSLLIEDALVQQFKTITPELAQKITDEVLKVMGKKSGQQAFKKAQDEIQGRIVGVLAEKYSKQNIQDLASLDPVVFDKFKQWAAQEGRTTTDFPEFMAREIITGGDDIFKTQIGRTEVRGLRDFFDQKISGQFLDKAYMNSISKRQAYQQFMEKLVTKEGKLNLEFIENNGELAIKQLNKIAAKNPPLANKALELARSGLEGVRFGFERLLSTTVGFGARDLPSKKMLALFAACEVLTWVEAKQVKPECLAILAVPWLKNHPTAVALVLSWLVEAEDSVNEKFKPVGINNLAINTPKLLGETRPFDLLSISLPYYVTLHVKGIGGHYGRRLYFVSPCKAKFDVYKRVCTCYNNPAKPQLSFGEGTTDVERESFSIKDWAVLEPKFNAEWQAMNAANRALYQNNLSMWLDERYEMINNSKNRVAYDLLGGGSRSRLPTLYIEDFDVDNVIKSCEQSDVMHNVINFGQRTWEAYLDIHGFGTTQERRNSLYGWDTVFKPRCLEVQPERLDGTYCYDHFPKTEFIRIALTFVQLAADSIITVLTGGIATPLALIGSGIQFATIDVVLEASEKWP